MRTAPKVMLGLGGVMLVIGILAFAIGGAVISDVSPDSEDWSGTLKWEGTTPTTYTGEFDWTHIYNVWVEEGSSVQVEVIDGDDENRFKSCEELEDCWIFDEDGAIPGFEYIGEVSFMDSGTWQVEFSGDNNVDVMIRDDDSFGGFLGILGGGGVCCFGILFLLIGGILAATMRDKPKAELSPVSPVGSDGVVVVHGTPAAQSAESSAPSAESPPADASAGDGPPVASDGEWWENSEYDQDDSA